MYAVVKTGGKQYKVAEGDVIDVEKLDAEPGDKVCLDVLMLSDGTKVCVGNEVADMKVEATVLEQFRGKKELVFKFKKRKRYQRTQGHRQYLTKIEVGALPGAAEPATEAVAEAEQDSEE